MHVGDVVRASYSLQPSPVLDRVSVRGFSVATTGKQGCLQAVTNRREAARGQISFKAICEGAAEVGIDVPSRKHITPAERQVVTIVPALEEPTGLNVQVGNYEQPEDGAQGVNWRAVTFEWLSRPDVIRTAFALYSPDGNVPIEEISRPAGSSSYRTLLQAGKEYRWEVRARYSGCVAGGELSPPARGKLFKVSD
jgi:hypothetical protein